MRRPTLMGWGLTYGLGVATGVATVAGVAAGVAAGVGAAPGCGAGWAAPAAAGGTAENKVLPSGETTAMIGLSLSSIPSKILGRPFRS